MVGLEQIGHAQRTLGGLEHNRRPSIRKAPHFACHVRLIGITGNCGQVCEGLLAKSSTCEIQKTLKTQHRLEYLRTIANGSRIAAEAADGSFQSTALADLWCSSLPEMPEARTLSALSPRVVFLCDFATKFYASPELVSSWKTFEDPILHTGNLIRLVNKSQDPRIRSLAIFALDRMNEPRASRHCCAIGLACE